MKILEKNQEYDYLAYGCGIGLGNFDGLHLGHMALISKLQEECLERKIPSLMYTFRSHPDNVLNKISKEPVTPQIITLEKKLKLLENTKLDYIYLEDFDLNYSKLSPCDFVEEILVKKFNIKLAVVGFNYTFGYKGQGNLELLMEYGEKYNFDVVSIPPIKIGNEVVSSTLLRKYVKKGALDKVRLYTGRDYSIYGTVEVGRQIGTSLGFPTANIIPERYLVLPKQGVYITRTLLDGETYDSITNIGRNPTFGENSNVSVETHIFGREGNMYGKRIEVFFLEMLREELKFPDKDELSAQIRTDIHTAKEFFKYRLKD